MRITTRGRYSIRASLTLARSFGRDVPMSVHQLSEEEQISSVFLEQIFFRLCRAGIVSSIRGPGGGYRFTKAPDKITLMEIMEAAGEELDVSECDKNAKTCRTTGKRCAAHSVWVDISSMITKYLNTTTLADILARDIIPIE